MADQSVQLYTVEGPQYRPRIMYFNLTPGTDATYEIETLADDGALDEQTVTLPATAGATQADYIVIRNVAGETLAAWLNIDGDGTVPTGAAYVAADYQVQVDISTGDSATDVGTAFASAIDGVMDDITVVDGLDGSVTVTQDLMGELLANTPHNADDSGAGSITNVVDVAGAASSLNDTFWLFESAVTEYFVWYNVNGEGAEPTVQPGIAGRTGVEVAIAAGASADDVAAATAAAIDALTGISASDSADVVTVNTYIRPDQSPPEDGSVPTGFDFSVDGSGSAAVFNNGKFDGTVLQPSEGVYVVTFNHNYARIPEGAVTAIEDTLVPRITAGDIFSITVEMQDLSGDPTDGGFVLIVHGSEAKDAIRQT